MEKLRKVFVGGVIFVTVLSMCVVAVPQAGATASAGDLIKMSGLSSVYYLAANGKRYVFPNEKTYFSWYSDFSGVVTVPQSELESYPLGANVTIRPGTKLVKITTDPKVYAVEPSGQLVWVPSETIASTLFGSNWAQRIVDVPDGFFTNYTVSTKQATATAYPTGSLVKFGTAADVYYIASDGKAQKIANETAFTANRFKWADVITAPSSITLPTLGTEITAAVATLIDTSSGAGGSAGAGTGLTVALASDTPAAATIITNTTTTTGNGQAMVPFLTVNFTASSDGDVIVKNLKFKRTGISADTDLDGLFLYDGSTRLTDASSISSTVTTFNNASGLFTVSKGTTKAITLKGDMNYAATSGKTIGFNLAAASDVTTNGAAVSGSFPIAGNLMSTANATDLGRLSFTGYASYPTAADTSISASDDQEVFRFTAQSNNQELKVEMLKLTAVGSIQLSDLKNFKLFVSGSQVGSTVTDMVSGNTVTFDMAANPLVIPKGSSKTVSLRADIKNGSTRTFYFSFQNQQDIIVKDASYNVYVEPYAAGTFSVIKPDGNYLVSSGSLSITKSTTSPTADVAVDATNVVLGIWDFTAAGENIKVQNLNVQADLDSGANGGILNGKVYLDDVQVGTTKNLTEATAVNFTFGSTFIVNAGVTAKVKVVGDIKTTTSTSYVGGEKVTITLTTGSSNAQRMTSLGTFNAPSTNTAANQLTITSAGLAISKYTGFGNKTVVAGSNNVRMGSFVLQAGAAEGVSVNSITVALSSDEAATVTNMILKDNATGTQLGETKVSPTSSNVYSVSINLAASSGKVIDLYANIKAGANAGNWIANIDADGSGISTSKSTSADATDIQTMTVASSGTLNATSGSHPDAAVLLAGSTGNYIGQFTFSASNESFTIDKMKFKIANNFSTSTAAITIKYYDSTSTQKTASGVFVAGTETFATATFAGLTMYVPAGSDSSVDVYVDLTTIAYGATSGASGAIYFDEDEGFNAIGSSGTTKTSPDNLTADLNGNTFYARKSKPTFARQTVTGSPSSSNALYRFTVVADSAGNIDIKQLGFNFVTSGCEITETYLYDANTSTQLTDNKVGPDGDGNVKLIVGDVDNDVLTIGTTAKTYEVRGTVSGYSSTAGDSITVQFKQDTSNVANGTAYAKGADRAANAANKYNVWSDRSASSHTTATTDWTNGYLIKNMTEAQSF